MSKKKKMEIQLACTRGENKPGDVIFVDESFALELLEQGMAVRPPKAVVSDSSGSDDQQLKEDLAAEKVKVEALEKALAAEKASVKNHEKAINVHVDTIKTLKERIENGGKGFDLLVNSVRELDPKAEDLAVKLEEFQKSLGDSSGDSGKKTKKK